MSLGQDHIHSPAISAPRGQRRSRAVMDGELDGPVVHLSTWPSQSLHHHSGSHTILLLIQI